MEVLNVLHMTGGDGETSYSNNSILQVSLSLSHTHTTKFPYCGHFIGVFIYLLSLNDLIFSLFLSQKTAISKARPFLEASVIDLYTNTFPECLRIADLGCSSGPNTLLVISEIIEAIEATCHEKSCVSPELQVFLNDLPGNDFNTIFKSLPSFYEKLKKEKGEEFGRCFISGVPGSFYGRLFPSTSLHFVHSSYSVHWLSQGFVDEAKIDSFNLPCYTPSAGEVRAIVEAEGSFNIDQLEIFAVNWDANDDDDNKDFVFEKCSSGQNVAKCIRAVTESLLATHFGEAVIDGLFSRYAEHVGEHLSKEKTKHINLVISMTKK
ncbi:hypothetical protein HHK36_008550 [Tetracentron sinense]|uniref:Uncharacterized protein n=1 Tax=Tetracentron sinense TaxID=13715 RepID=A0A834ZJQ4_TETSI|nr:hypothetical protein HHK36_008550 [Tetracentron sinense]